MMRKSKFCRMMMSLLLLMTAAGCSTAAPTPAPTMTPQAATTPQPEFTPATPAPQEETSSVLVVYFSAAGNTERAAEMIAEQTGGQLMALEPAEPYSEEDLDYNDENSRVSMEYADPSRRTVELVQTTPEGWDDITTVFIGYPIWWGEAAWPVTSFVEANDFSGKTVIPFCTSASSGLGDSAQQLADSANGGTWREGRRFSSSVSEEELRSWLDELGL